MSSIPAFMREEPAEYEIPERSGGSLAAPPVALHFHPSKSATGKQAKKTSFQHRFSSADILMHEAAEYLVPQAKAGKTPVKSEADYAVLEQSEVGGADTTGEEAAYEILEHDKVRVEEITDIENEAEYDELKQCGMRRATAVQSEDEYDVLRQTGIRRSVASVGAVAEHDVLRKTNIKAGKANFVKEESGVGGEQSGVGVAAEDDEYAELAQSMEGKVAMWEYESEYMEIDKQETK